MNLPATPCQAAEEHDGPTMEVRCWNDLSERVAQLEARNRTYALENSKLRCVIRDGLHRDPDVVLALVHVMPDGELRFVDHGHAGQQYGNTYR